MQSLIVILQYILAIIGLSLIVIVHEFGHFLMAKLSGIHVEEFFIGFGPKLFKFKDRRGTTYGISAIPVGGYNKLLGMDRNESIPPDMKDKSYHNKPFYKKLLVSIGGPVFNVIFAVILIGIFLSMGVLVPTTIIDYVQPEAPAEKNGFEIGDEVVALNDQKIESWDDFSVLTKKYPGKEVTYTVIRNGEEIKLEVKLNNVEGQGYLGISPSSVEEKLGFLEIVKESFKMTWDISIGYVKVIGMLFSGKIPLSEARPVSPIGVVSIFQQYASTGMQNFIFFVAFVSILIGFSNLIPILPLDGGNIVLIIIEAIRRKPVPRKVLEIFNFAGIFILVSILIIGIVFDIIKPFNIMNM
ncbi:MAG: site-2 protease family protein [Actinobacteria bacterium]|nr:site-2 protease family protein [Actinomycetota bacterium]